MKLSICIATFNRAAFIGETLASIGDQLEDDVEVVVLDGASPDETATVVEAAASRWPSIRYIRASTNSGVDTDYDLAVEHAQGSWIWLCADDDLLAPNAIAKVLAELARSDPDLLVVDAEIRDRKVDVLFEPHRMKFADRKEYGPGQRDELLSDVGNALSFIGGTIFRRSAWLGRDRRSFYGSLFIHVGVALQEPPLRRSVVLPESLVLIRIGNANWTARSFEIWMFLWPDLIWRLPGYADKARAAVTSRAPYREIGRLLIFRARGSFGRAEYDRFLHERSLGMRRLPIWLLARTPGLLIHFVTVVLLALAGFGRGSMMYEINHNSVFANRASMTVARVFGMHGTAA